MVVDCSSVPTEAIQRPSDVPHSPQGQRLCVAVVGVGGGCGDGGGGGLLSVPTEAIQRPSDVPHSPQGQRPVWLLLVVVVVMVVVVVDCLASPQRPYKGPLMCLTRHRDSGLCGCCWCWWWLW